MNGVMLGFPPPVFLMRCFYHRFQGNVLLLFLLLLFVFVFYLTRRRSEEPLFVSKMAILISVHFLFFFSISHLSK